MPYRTAIFDMDGTILNTLDDLRSSVNVSLRRFGFPERTREEIRRFVGNGARKLVERAVPAGTDEATVQHVLDFYKPYYEAHSQLQTAPYDGIPAMLTRLRAQGVRLAVASNKPDGAVKLLAAHYFPGLFDAAVGDTEGLRVKPSPDLLREAMRLLGADTESAVYIGDSEVDIATARNACLPCLSVTWGFRDAAFLAGKGAKTLVRTADELENLILY